MAAVVRCRPVRLDPSAVAAGGGLAGAASASVLWLMLVFRSYDEGLEAWDSVDERWFVAFVFAWLAGLGLSIVSRCLRRPAGQACRGLSLAGMILSGLLVAVSPGGFLMMVFAAIP